MKTIKDFKNSGEWVVKAGGEGYLISEETFEKLQECEEVEEIYYDQEGRYVAKKYNGDRGYFYIIPDGE